MTNKKLLYLSRKDIVSVGVTMTEVIEVVKQGFTELGKGRVEMPPKPGIHPGDGEDNFIHAMPAYIPGLNAAGMKWIGGFLENRTKGLPYISGLIILNDTDTGLPISVMDCVWITGMRTGAASALSATYLARPSSSIIGILGCGIQGHTNLEAMSVLFPLKRVMAYDTHPDQSEKLTRYARNGLGLKAEIVKDPRHAVTGCDIVVTAGPLLKTPHETIRSGWLDPGAFASCVDFDSYWSRAAFNEADKWTTDHINQYRHYKNHLGFFKNCPEVYADLGELVTGKKGGRATPEEKTFSVNLGLAMEDISVAPLVFKRAVENNIGTWLPL